MIKSFGNNGPVTASMPLVRRRCVIYVPGYEPLSATHIYRRFETELDRFRRTWNVSATLSQPTSVCDGAISWRIDSAGPNWLVETDLTLLDWSDIVVADFAQPRTRLILRGLAAIFDFLLSGAAMGYLRTNWRYLLFYIYPVFLLSLFCAAALVIVRFAGVPWPSVLGPVLWIACVALLVHWAGLKLYLYDTLLNWSFAADIVHQRRPEFEAKLDQLARVFAERVHASTADEIIVFSHSLGSVIMMQVVARALQHNPRLTYRDTKINLLSAGSSLLKVGLHSKAEHIRAAVRKVVNEPAIYWVEYQALVDLLNFYKTDPVSELGLPACGKPIVRIVRIRRMMTNERYRRIRWKPYRLHLQYALGNECRYVYDFFMICCGPLPLQCRVEWPAEETVVAFARDGTYQFPALASDALPAKTVSDQ